MDPDLKEYLIFLDDLRESGVESLCCSAAHYLMDAFPLDRQQAHDVVLCWLARPAEVA